MTNPDGMDVVLWIVAIVAAGGVAAAISTWSRRQRALTKGEAEKSAHAATLRAIQAAAAAEAAAIKRQAEIDARSAAQGLRVQADAELRRVAEELANRARGF